MRHQQSLTKLNAKQVAYKWKFPSLDKHVWLWQEFKLYHRGSHHIASFFYAFQKKSPEFSITWNKINISLNLLISYSSITQTYIKHSLPTSFKFRVNLYIKSVISKTRENSRLKTRYFKEITTEQLFVISIEEIILSPLYFIQLLKTN